MVKTGQGQSLYLFTFAHPLCPGLPPLAPKNTLDSIAGQRVMDLLDVLAGQVPSHVATPARRRRLCESGAVADLLDVLAVPSQVEAEPSPVSAQPSHVARSRSNWSPDTWKEYMKRVRAGRALRRANQKAEQAQVLAQAWGDTQLCVGDHAALVTRKQQIPKGLRLHNLTVVYKEAFEPGFGARINDKRERTNHRALINSAATLAQQNALQDFLGATRSWLHIERLFDETPYHFSFGLCADALAPIARYFVPPKYRPRSSEERSYHSYEHCIDLGMKLGHHGVLDVVAMKIKVAGSNGANLDSAQRRSLHIRPRIALGKHAGFVFAALDQALEGEFSIEKLCALAKTVPALVFANYVVCVPMPEFLPSRSWLVSPIIISLHPLPTTLNHVGRRCYI